MNIDRDSVTHFPMVIPFQQSVFSSCSDSFLHTWVVRFFQKFLVSETIFLMSIMREERPLLGTALELVELFRLHEKKKKV